MRLIIGKETILEYNNIYYHIVKATIIVIGRPIRGFNGRIIALYLKHKIKKIKYQFCIMGQ